MNIHHSFLSYKNLQYIQIYWDSC